MEVDGLISMTIVHRHKVVTENAPAHGAILQRYADIIIILDTRQRILCLCVMEESVMVAFDQYNLTIQAFDEIVGIAVPGFPNKVAKDIYKVTLADFCVPSTDEFCIHFFNGSKRTMVKANHIFVSEMQVACKKHLSQREHLP